MAQLLEIPCARLAAQTLQTLLEDFASRDGTDYGVREHSLEEKVGELRRGLDSGVLRLLYDVESEHWDLVERERAAALLAAQGWA
ncbi:MAG: YheU family protein [Parahaliea sp.]